MKYSTTLFLLLLALVSNAQTEPGFIVHEWGTFTSHYSGNGVPYTDLYKTANEPVPSFVHNIIFTHSQTHTLNDKNGIYTYTGVPTLSDVTQKMETPVLYFYSDKGISNLNVGVRFPQGSISEFYPLPFVNEDTGTIKAKTSVDNWGHMNLSFKNYNGFALWKINVLPSYENVQTTQPDAAVPNVWLAPRKTKSNLIESNGEIEKYIFYRGLGGFTSPVVPRYTKSGKILLENNATEEISYLIVYEMTPDGKRYIWGESSIEKGIIKAFVKSKIVVGDQRWKDFYRAHFIDNLVKAGLYHDEAEAMLNTWNESYFGKPGIKVFWIVPRSFTDKILPISFSAPVSELQRVMVGRTEIDAYSSNDTSYIEDPIITTDVENVIYNIWPNPSNGVIYITSNKLLSEDIIFDLIDFSGRLVRSGSMKLEAGTENQLLFGKLDKGIYCLNIKGRSPKRFSVVVN
jgi:hypothetical protein